MYFLHERKPSRKQLYLLPPLPHHPPPSFPPHFLLKQGLPDPHTEGTVVILLSQRK